MSKSLQEALESLRAAEREQAAFYRRLAVLAEAADDTAIAQRLHDLHADEQHHLSRLTARLVELGHTPAAHPAGSIDSTGLEVWETEARDREHAEIARYEAFLRTEADDVTRTLVEGILEVEHHHRDELGGKWTVA